MPSPSDVFTTLRIATAKSGSSGVFGNGSALFVMANKQLNETKLASSSYIQIIRLPGGTSVIVTALSGTFRD